MESRLAHSYYCQDNKCGHTEKTREILCGQACPKCGKSKMEDWPPNAEGPVSDLRDEQSLEYFNRYVAGDR
jgi:predicted  nucleic acid-binding Zn-ribbon protein